MKIIYILFFLVLPFFGLSQIGAFSKLKSNSIKNENSIDKGDNQDLKTTSRSGIDEKVDSIEIKRFGSELAYNKRGTIEFVNEKGEVINSINHGDYFALNVYFNIPLSEEKMQTFKLRLDDGGFYEFKIPDSVKVDAFNFHQIPLALRDTSHSTSIRALKYLDKLEKGSNSVEFTVSCYGKAEAMGKLSIFKANDGESYEKLIEDNNNQSLSLVEVPDAQMKNPLLEEKMIASFNTTDYFQEKSMNGYAVRIIDKDWLIYKDQLGRITSRYVRTYVLAKDSNGNCFFWDVDYKEPYLGEDKYGEVTWKRLGSKKQIDCSKYPN